MKSVVYSKTQKTLGFPGNCVNEEGWLRNAIDEAKRAEMDKFDPKLLTKAREALSTLNKAKVHQRHH